MAAILVDDGVTLTAARTYADAHFPDLVPLIQRYDGATPLLARVEDELAHGMAQRVTLAGGGAVTFDSMVALTAVDVDFGAAPGAGRRNPVDINLAAADEIAACATAPIATAWSRPWRRRASTTVCPCR